MDAEPAERIVSYLNQRSQEMVALLAELVRAESPSNVPQSQAQVLYILGERLAQLSYRVSRLAGRNCAGHLYARPRRPAGRHTQLLLGHCDTVWPLGTLADMPLTIGDGVLRGPGSYDMKAGLVQMLFALEALRALQVEPPLAPVVFINSDEEIGSHDSTRHIRRLARVARWCWNRRWELRASSRLRARAWAASR